MLFSPFFSTTVPATLGSLAARGNSIRDSYGDIGAGAAYALGRGVNSVEQPARNIATGTAFTIGDTRTRAEIGISNVATTAKYAAIGVGVVVGGLVLLKTLDTIKEVFE